GFHGVLDVHTDHHHATITVGTPAALQDGGLVVARGLAPGGPEVHHDDLAALLGEGERLALEGGEHERRRRAADQRRGDLTGIEAKAVGEQREHGYRRQGDHPAPHPSHAGCAPRGTTTVATTGLRSGRMASSAPRVRMPPPIQIQLTRRFTCTLIVAWEPSRTKSPSTR